MKKKRDGHEHTAEEIRQVIEMYLSGELAEYQMSAWLMAVYHQGMSVAETNTLTDTMLHSGDVVDLSNLPERKVDKHSTGGVGDKVSIALAPWVAACGVRVPMVSGRGLGHTGGTLDKLEAIPGFNVNLDLQQFRKLVGEVGTAMCGQTGQIAPADKRIYALRDVTATVSCIPLIVASILSKKLAEGIDALVLDVKVGRGAFMKDRAQATALAQALCRVGARAKKDVVALLTNMNTPLGLTVGNAIETREAIELLHGKGPGDLMTCTRALAQEMLILGDVADSVQAADSLLDKALEDGSALDVMTKMVVAQGGDGDIVANPDKLALAPVKVALKAKTSGYVRGIDPLALGYLGVAIGAGRKQAADPVDHAVGIELGQTTGAKVSAGDELGFLYLRDSQPADEHLAEFAEAFEIGDEAPHRRRAHPRPHSRRIHLIIAPSARQHGWLRQRRQSGLRGRASLAGPRIHGQGFGALPCRRNVDSAQSRLKSLPHSALLASVTQA